MQLSNIREKFRDHFADGPSNRNIWIVILWVVGLTCAFFIKKNEQCVRHQEIVAEKAFDQAPSLLYMNDEELVFCSNDKRKPRVYSLPLSFAEIPNPVLGVDLPHHEAKKINPAIISFPDKSAQPVSATYDQESGRVAYPYANDGRWYIKIVNKEGRIGGGKTFRINTIPVVDQDPQKTYNRIDCLTWIKLQHDKQPNHLMIFISSFPTTLLQQEPDNAGPKTLKTKEGNITDFKLSIVVLSADGTSELLFDSEALAESGLNLGKPRESNLFRWSFADLEVTRSKSSRALVQVHEIVDNPTRQNETTDPRRLFQVSLKKQPMCNCPVPKIMFQNEYDGCVPAWGTDGVSVIYHQKRDSKLGIGKWKSDLFILPRINGPTSKEAYLVPLNGDGLRYPVETKLPTPSLHSNNQNNSRQKTIDETWLFFLSEMNGGRSNLWTVPLRKKKPVTNGVDWITLEPDIRRLTELTFGYTFVSRPLIYKSGQTIYIALVDSDDSSAAIPSDIGEHMYQVRVLRFNVKDIVEHTRNN